MFAAELSGNKPMRDAIRGAVERRVPVYAECGGLMYLGQSLADLEGKEHPMLGVVPAVSRMSDKRLTLGYREVEAASDGPLLRKGQRVRGHEFHWSTLDQPPSAGQSVYRVVNKTTGWKASRWAASGRRTSTFTWEATLPCPGGSWTPAPGLFRRTTEPGILEIGITRAKQGFTVRPAIEHSRP